MSLRTGTKTVKESKPLSFTHSFTFHSVRVTFFCNVTMLQCYIFFELPVNAFFHSLYLSAFATTHKYWILVHVSYHRKALLPMAYAKGSRALWVLLVDFEEVTSVMGGGNCLIFNLLCIRVHFCIFCILAFLCCKVTNKCAKYKIKRYFYSISEGLTIFAASLQHQFLGDIATPFQAGLSTYSVNSLSTISGKNRAIN